MESTAISAATAKFEWLSVAAPLLVEQVVPAIGSRPISRGSRPGCCTLMFSSLATSTPSTTFALAAAVSELQVASLASQPSSSTDMALTMAAASSSLMSGNHPNHGQCELI